ncbi:MAG: class II aldolase/adducin family protein [Lachnospiraceae bacterium]|nr:class II aldolase/adducin family protein [Lachnospiraceae bacterium]
MMYEKQKEELVEICHLLYRRNLVAASDGNVSVRVSDAHILLTPSGKNKGLVRREEILVLDLEGAVVDGTQKPSREYPMHREIYRRRADVRAVVHTHPACATAFALAGKNLPENYLIETSMMLGATALADYAAPGSPELVDAIAPHIQSCSAILLKNHGALTLGTSLEDAFNRMEVLENVAKTILLSKVLGEPETIAEHEMAKMRRQK